MGDYLIVDGYNVIFAWSEFEKLRKAGMDHAREKLVDMLVNYAALSGDRVIVVFDAHLVRNQVERTEMVGKHLEIIYTQEGETADTVIERLVAEHSEEGSVHVATSDRAEQSMIFGMGAYRMTPKELHHKLKVKENEAKDHYDANRPAESYLEDRLVDEIRKTMEQWRRQKG